MKRIIITKKNNLKPLLKNGFIVTVNSLEDRYLGKFTDLINEYDLLGDVLYDEEDIEIGDVFVFGSSKDYDFEIMDNMYDFIKSFKVHSSKIFNLKGEMREVRRALSKYIGEEVPEKKASISIEFKSLETPKRKSRKQSKKRQYSGVTHLNRHTRVGLKLHKRYVDGFNNKEYILVNDKRYYVDEDEFGHDYIYC